MLDDRLHDEPARLRALQRYGVLDTAREPDFDGNTNLVREILCVETCAVSLLDLDRQWFKSVAGDLVVRQTPRDDAFCHVTIQARGPLVIEDARDDKRFADNPLVTGDPFIRSYAGVPLCSPEGYNLGSLCVFDPKPRSFLASETQMMGRFSRLVVEQLELRTLAHRDLLTDALTKRAFANAGRRVFTERERARLGALIMLDIDHFKSVEALRESDCPPVTASFGIAPLRSGPDLDLALAEADAALYAAKRRGRNCCLLSDSACHLAA